MCTPIAAWLCESLLSALGSPTLQTQNMGGQSAAYLALQEEVLRLRKKLAAQVFAALPRTHTTEILSPHTATRRTLWQNPSASSNHQQRGTSTTPASYRLDRLTSGQTVTGQSFTQLLLFGKSTALFHEASATPTRTPSVTLREGCRASAFESPGMYPYRHVRNSSSADSSSLALFEEGSTHRDRVGHLQVLSSPAASPSSSLAMSIGATPMRNRHRPAFLQTPQDEWVERRAAVRPKMPFARCTL